VLAMDEYDRAAKVCTVSSLSCKIWRSHSAVTKGSGFVGCEAVLFVDWCPIFEWIIIHSSLFQSVIFRPQSLTVYAVVCIMILQCFDVIFYTSISVVQQPISGLGNLIF
jgi:hypothetical protein